MINSQRFKKEALSFIALLAAGAMIYFGMQHFRHYSGKKAFEATGLTPLTLAEAMVKANAEGKPILADMSAYWCGTCVHLDKTVLADATVKEAITNRYVYARIDSESPEAPAFKKAYDVYGYPSLVILEPDGTLIKKLKLTFNTKEFMAQL